jgi:hypothetical protein
MAEGQPENFGGEPLAAPGNCLLRNQLLPEPVFDSSEDVELFPAGARVRHSLAPGVLAATSGQSRKRRTLRLSAIGYRLFVRYTAFLLALLCRAIGANDEGDPNSYQWWAGSA